jgi:hypothetical protein
MNASLLRRNLNRRARVGLDPDQRRAARNDLDNRWFLNLDLKKVWLKTNASINGGGITGKVHLDPWIVGAGVGYRF